MNRDSRLPSLTGLRFAAALVVFGQHLLELFYDPQLVAPRPVRAAVWASLVNDGGMGVSFFFVLSGFVLTLSARPTVRPGRFWRQRLAKIYPATLVTTLAAAVVTGGAGPVAYATHLTLTQTWLPDPAVYGALNPVSWSLSAEAFFYLCFPALLPAVRRLGPRGLRTAGVGLVAVVVTLDAGLTAAPRPVALWVGYLLPPVRLAEFALGIVVASLVRAGAWRGPGLGWSGVLVAGGAVTALAMPFPLNQHATTLVPVLCVVAAAARADLSGVRTVWAGRAARYLGELSFPFYLVHYLVFVLFSRLGLLPHHAHPLVAALATVSLFSCSVLAAMALHHGVELPALRLLRPRRLPPAPPPFVGVAKVATAAAPPGGRHAAQVTGR